MVIFVTEYVILGKIVPFYEVSEKRGFPDGGILKIFNSRPLITIIFMTKMVVLDTYSTCRVKTMLFQVK